VFSGFMPVSPHSSRWVGGTRIPIQSERWFRLGLNRQQLAVGGLLTDSVAPFPYGRERCRA
jgi:hypothetical protein